MAELDIDALRRLDGSLPWRADQDPVYRNGHYIRSSSGTLIATVSPDMRAHTADIVAIVNQLPAILAALERGALEVDRLRDRLCEKNEIITAYAGPSGMTPEDVAHAVEQAAYWERTAAQIDEALGVKIDRIAAERDGARALIARMLPLVDHDSRAGCPMAFHRSDSEQCACGALDVVAEARALLARGGDPCLS